MGEGGKEGSLFSEDNGPRDSLWHGVEEDIVRVLSLYDKRCSPFFFLFLYDCGCRLVVDDGFTMRFPYLLSSQALCTASSDLHIWS